MRFVVVGVRLVVLAMCVAVPGCAQWCRVRTPTSPQPLAPGVAPVPFPSPGQVGPTESQRPVIPPPAAPGEMPAEGDSIIPPPIPTPGADVPSSSPPPATPSRLPAARLPESPPPVVVELCAPVPEQDAPAAVPPSPDRIPQSPPPVRQPDEPSPTPQPALPVGIPQFAEVQDGIAAGQRPFLDGLDWLKEKGYRTVLHLVQPDSDDSADEKQIEKRGMMFLRFAVSPESLTAAAYREFERIIDDPLNRPLFVYDEDGALAGPLWYLYFRRKQGRGHEEALREARSLGLRPDRSPLHRQMWQAAERIAASP